MEVTIDEIKKKSVIYNNSSQRYSNRLSECSFQLRLNNPALCDNKEPLYSNVPTNTLQQRLQLQQKINIKGVWFWIDIN